VDYNGSGSRFSSSKAPQENGLEFNLDVENGSLSGSEASTVVQGSDATSQSVAELQQSIKAIQEDNSAMTANLQNLRDLVEKQTAKLKQQEEKGSISGIEQQLAEIQERVKQQGEQLEGIRSNGNSFASRISALEDTEGQLGNQLGDLETRLAGRISGLEETWSKYSGVEERLGVRISQLEEARSQRIAMEGKLSGRIDALEQHLRATNTNIGE
jgi:chromosome segregation ATPase